MKRLMSMEPWVILGALVVCAIVISGSECEAGRSYPAPVAQTLPTPRFADNGNGTVTDNLTGLIWLKNANCFSAGQWSTAVMNAVFLATGACGLTDGSQVGDWRLPGVEELESLLDYTYFNPSLSNAARTGRWTEGNPFTGVQLNGYWSLTTLVSYPGSAWVVYFTDGYVNADDKMNTYYVWPVR